MEELITLLGGAAALFIGAIVMMFVFAFIMMLFGTMMTVIFSLISIVLDIILIPLVIVDVGLMSLIERHQGEPRGWKADAIKYALLVVANSVLLAAAASFFVDEPLRILLPAFAIGTLAAVSSMEWSFVPSLLRERKLVRGARRRERD